MSAANNIPFEIQEEIIKRILPVKSLLRFRSVSKQWKSLIGSSEFITEHSANRNHQHHILVRYIPGYQFKYVSIVDDDSFPQHKFFPVVNLVDSSVMLVSSHGLVCLYSYERGLTNRSKLAVLWNPLIRKSVGGIVLPPVFTALGFGVCPKTSDPKIVTITRITTGLSEIQTIGWKAEVFTLSTGSWRSIPINNMQLPLKELTFHYEQVARNLCSGDGVLNLTYSLHKQGLSRFASNVACNCNTTECHIAHSSTCELNPYLIFTAPEGSYKVHTEVYFSDRPVLRACNSKAILEKHLKTTGGKVPTRFHRNKWIYLHIGHAKAMFVGFGFAKERGGGCYLRLLRWQQKKRGDGHLEGGSLVGHAYIAKEKRWIPGYRSFEGADGGPKNIARAVRGLQLSIQMFHHNKLLKNHWKLLY